MEAHHAERAAQKARREAEAKAKEEAEKQRVAEEEKRKKRMMEYLQQLWDEVLEEEAALLEGVTNFIQLISPQPVDRFSQTKLLWKAPNEGYLYKSNNERLRYQAISSCKNFVC